MAYLLALGRAFGEAMHARVVYRIGDIPFSLFLRFGKRVVCHRNLNSIEFLCHLIL